MFSIDCKKFATNDLEIFIESIEKIMKVEKSRRERHQKFKYQILKETSCETRDFPYLVKNSSKLMPTHDPADEEVDIEEPQLLAVTDTTYNVDASEDGGYESISLQENEYLQIIKDDYEICYDDVHSIPLYTMETGKILESIRSYSSFGTYEEIFASNFTKVPGKKSTFRQCLSDLLHKCIGNNS